MSHPATFHRQLVLQNSSTNTENLSNTGANQKDDLDELLGAITPPPLKCEDIWFDDGNIILHVDNTIFRVHKSILVKHSSIWKTMASLPQPGHSDVKTISCVVLHDNVQDVKKLLMVFYNPLYFMYSLNSFQFLASILRMSTKYDIAHLRAAASAELRRAYPRRLGDFDDNDFDLKNKLVFQVDQNREDKSTVPASAQTRIWAERFAIEAVNLARETSLTVILPCALYYCARLPIETIVRGTSNARLSPEDVNTCMLGREILLKKQRELTHPFLYTLPPLRSSGKYPTPCSDGTCVMGGYKPLLSYILDEMTVTKPIALERFMKWSNIGRCIMCAIPLESAHLRKREVIWEELPNIFGLGVWKDLDG
ncbi:hypothetical protein BJ138DRAFT_1154936 [Hygrophoropsis aurantiaca]|uniref:Uncharacterized protein n=1 Tax=Hygrophoropsis aurantiaca TaxID=72124 RepID=A0ACB8AA98_9AGAM|nr:hypothetical protein BJ138DRAFT_1154936 [Hygrophoropsis aurantiaca]